MIDNPTGFGPGFDTRGWGMLNFGKGVTPAEFITKAKEIAPKDGVRQFIDKPAIRFYCAGGTIHEEWVNENHKMQYPQQWAAYQNKQEQTFEGTILETCPIFSPSHLATLKLAGFRTVQQFADAPLTAVQQCGMGAVDLQKKAKSWVKACAQNGQATDLANENAQLRSEVDILKKQLGDLAARVGAPQALGSETWPKNGKEAAEGKK